MAKLMSVPQQTDEETTKEPSEFKGVVQQHPSLLSSGTKTTVQSGWGHMAMLSFIQHFWVNWKHVSRCSLGFNSLSSVCAVRWCSVLAARVFTLFLGFQRSHVPKSLLLILDSRGHTNPSSAWFYIPAKTDALFSLLQKNKCFCFFLPFESDGCHLGLCDYSILIEIGFFCQVIGQKKDFFFFNWINFLEEKMGILFLFCSGTGEGSLDRLLPPVSTGLSPRKRTTSQCKSEPPLLRTSKRTIYTAGRPPWYNEHGTQSKEAFVIGRTWTMCMHVKV